MRWLWVNGRCNWQKIDSKVTNRTESKLAWWGLVERTTGHDKRGYYRLTELGRAFLFNEVRIPEFAKCYCNHLLRLEDDDGASLIYCRQVRKWNYDEEMRGV